jgi:hypothetical protein
MVVVVVKMLLILAILSVVFAIILSGIILRKVIKRHTNK